VLDGRTTRFRCYARRYLTCDPLPPPDAALPRARTPRLRFRRWAALPVAFCAFTCLPGCQHILYLPAAIVLALYTLAWTLSDLVLFLRYRQGLDDLPCYIGMHCLQASLTAICYPY